MTNQIPTPEEVKEYFSSAKEVRCLNLDVIVNIKHVNRIEFKENTNSYVSSGGLIVFWKDGNFATITKKKCLNCKNCNCK